MNSKDRGFGLFTIVVGTLCVLLFVWLMDHTLGFDSSTVTASAGNIAVLRDFPTDGTVLIESERPFVVAVDGETYTGQQAENDGVLLQHYSLVFHRLPNPEIRVTEGSVSVRLLRGNTVFTVIPDPDQPSIIPFLGILTSVGLIALGLYVTFSRK